MRRIEKYPTFLTEKSQTNPLLVCDIQPAYIDHIHFDLLELIEYIETFDRIYWLYNGPDIGYDDTDLSISEWLLELGITEETIDNIIFFEKGYGYYRDQMDYCLNHEEVVDILKLMKNNNYEDSTEITENLYGVSDEVKGYLKEYPFSNNIDLQEFLEQDNNYILIGGALAECVAEVKIDLEVMDISFKLNEDFVF